MEFVYYMAVFAAGGLAFLALAMAINKAYEFKKGKKETEQKPIDVPLPIIREVRLETVPICATLTIPKERILESWNTEIYGIKDEQYVASYVEKRLKKELADELWKHVSVEAEENMMNMTLRYKAMVRVVKP